MRVSNPDISLGLDDGRLSLWFICNPGIALKSISSQLLDLSKISLLTIFFWLKKCFPEAVLIPKFGFQDFSRSLF